jgi:glucan phosphoethanolaminetransferase (alkaline phosphatase superfamily)
MVTFGDIVVSWPLLLVGSVPVLLLWWVIVYRYRKYFRGKPLVVYDMTYGVTTFNVVVVMIRTPDETGCPVWRPATTHDIPHLPNMKTFQPSSSGPQSPGP